MTKIYAVSDNPSRGVPFLTAILFQNLQEPYAVAAEALEAENGWPAGHGKSWVFARN